MKSKLLLMGILMCSGICAALAQSNAGEINGRVILKSKSKNQIPLDYVSITLLNSKNEILRELFSDSNGFYKCANLPPGDYGLRFVNLGYAYTDFMFIPVDTGRSTYQQVAMKELEGGIRINSTCYMRINSSPARDSTQTSTDCGFAHQPKPEETKSSKPAPDEIHVVPIPGSNTFKVETLYDGKKSILIQSIAGREYLRETFVKHTRVNIGSFPQGMYLITITDRKSNDKTYVKLIIKNE